MRPMASDDLIIRTEHQDDAQRLLKSKTIIKNGYENVSLKAHNPKIIIFGIPFKTKEELTDSIYEENEQAADEDHYLFI